MALTEKGYNAARLIQQYYPNGKFSAADLTAKSGQTIVAATLNAVAKNGVLNRYETSPITFELIPGINIESLAPIGKKKTAGNDNLHNALKTKNDEFFTFYKDIEAECSHYTHHFKNKIIYLNCDDEDSQFWQYFFTNFVSFGLKGLIATHLDKENTSYKIVSIDGINIQRIPLTGIGDFSSEECQEILDEADIIITNPPFSRFREMVSLILKHNKKFLLIGNENTFASTEIFPLIKDNLVWTGFNKVRQFLQPDGTTKDFGNICWFTNLEIEKDIPFITLTEKYSVEAYPFYDNFEAINIDRVELIPCDYYGIMGIPVSYLGKYNPKQFEIIGLAAGNTKTNKLNFDVPYTPHELDRGGCGVVKGVRKYSRVFVKRRV